MNKTTYRVCKRCVMDTSAQEIIFNADGNCNFCESMMSSSQSTSIGSAYSYELKSLIEKVKANGTGKDYDCIIGVSGGVDSSWTLVQAVKFGLRPLAVHMDNGWNSELATNNISNLIEKLDVDLYTYVIEWEEYRSLMEAFFDADVIDIELLYDNAMTEVCYMKAREHGLKYILSGSNTATEGLKMPSKWAYGDKWDGTNILSIASKNNVQVSSFPLFTNAKWLYSRFVKGIQWIPFLDYMVYEKNSAVTGLIDNFSYKPYPYKHYENVFTRFYQGYILPEKFKVDKRRVHFSSLIVSGQLERTDAIVQLNSLPFSSTQELRFDKEYFLKKMRWENAQLDNYLSRPRREHTEFKTDRVRKYLWPILRFIGRTQNDIKNLLR